MDSSRVWIRLAWLALFLLAAPAGPARAASGQSTFRLTPKHRPGEISRVEVVVQVGGDMRFVTDGKSKDLPMSVLANLKYDEQLLAIDGAGRANRSVRHYEDAHAVIKVDKGGEKPGLDAQHRVIVAEKTAQSAAVLYSPAGPLRREELDLVDVPGNTLLLDHLLPSEEIAPGKSWKVTDETLAALLGLDAVSWSDVDCMLAGVADNVADVSAGGSVSGAVCGVSTDVELKVKLKFDLKTNRINFFALLIKEKRSVGHVGPGLDTVAKVVITITPKQQSAGLTAAFVKSLPEKVTPELTRLIYVSPGGRIRFQYDRCWYVTTDESKLAVLRMIDRGDLVAQCNLSPLKETGKPVTLAEFQRDVQSSLGKNFGQFVKASQSTTPSGQTMFRVVVQGTVSQLPIEWIYYLVEDDKGRGASMAFTFEQELESRFGKADRDLIANLRLTQPVAPTAAKPVKQK
jgi:hypothetical protein